MHHTGNSLDNKGNLISSIAAPSDHLVLLDSYDWEKDNMEQLASKLLKSPNAGACLGSSQVSIIVVQLFWPSRMPTQATECNIGLGYWSVLWAHAGVWDACLPQHYLTCCCASQQSVLVWASTMPITMFILCQLIIIAEFPFRNPLCSATPQLQSRSPWIGWAKNYWGVERDGIP